MKDALVFYVTTHRRLPGARLSLSGHWGNLPHDSVESANQAARDHAAGRAYVIERERH